MINYEEFLLNNINKEQCGTYAIVTYNGIEEATYFQHVYDEIYGLWFMPSPCILYKIGKCENPYDKKWYDYFKELLEEGESVEDYIKEYVKPMIIGNVLYEIENFQCLPYLPKEVDNIRIISERKCLEWLVNIEPVSK